MRWEDLRVGDSFVGRSSSADYHGKTYVVLSTEVKDALVIVRVLMEGGGMDEWMGYLGEEYYEDELLGRAP